MRQHERALMLYVIDTAWKDHLLAMDHLKEGIGLRGYGQRDPLTEYKKESFMMFGLMKERIEDEIIMNLWRMDAAVVTQQREMRTRRERDLTYSAPVKEAPQPAQRATGRGRRNDPCPRGSGKKDTKRHESGMIVDPVTIHPEQKIAEALDLMQKFKISGVPVTDRSGRLLGILTNRDLRFETRTDLPVSAVMTKEHLVTVPVGTTLEEAKSILHKHKIEKLLVVDREYHLKGLITVKDIQKMIRYPHACKDALGRLRVGAAVRVRPDEAERARVLLEARADVLVVDTAHGHTTGVMEMVQRLRKTLVGVDLVAGNVATPEAAEDPIEV